MTKELVNYNAARKALALAHRVDEVKSIRDKAVAMQVYAKQAKDTELIDHATDIRLRAERRLGEIMKEEREAGKLAKGARAKGVGRRGKRASAGDARSLADQGIDVHLADRARKAAAMSEEEFEAKNARAKKIAVAVTEGDREVLQAAKAERQQEKALKRAAKEKEKGGAGNAVVTTPVEDEGDDAETSAAAENTARYVPFDLKFDNPYELGRAIVAFINDAQRSRTIACEILDELNREREGGKSDNDEKPAEPEDSTAQAVQDYARNSKAAAAAGNATESAADSAERCKRDNEKKFAAPDDDDDLSNPAHPLHRPARAP
jgi:hypothetical protein